MVETSRKFNWDFREGVINVQSYPMAVSQVAQPSLRSVIGRADLDTLLSDRDRINRELKDVIDAPTEEPWGLHVERVEVKDVSLPEGMKRSMSRQPDAEGERRARILGATSSSWTAKAVPSVPACAVAACASDSRSTPTPPPPRRALAAEGADLAGHRFGRAAVSEPRQPAV